MATYGWVREDDLDAYFERTAPGRINVRPFPLTCLCPYCNDLFHDQRALQDHIVGAHSIKRPAIWIGGLEPPRLYNIRRQLRSEDILVENATEAAIRVNGGPAEIIQLRRLPECLSKFIDAEVHLSLANGSESKAAPVNIEYDFRFRVASADEYRLVEHSFREKVLPGEVSMTSIRAFLEDERCNGLGRDYADGIAKYLRGIFLKDRAGDPTGHTTEGYRESFVAALYILEGIDRKFASLLSDIICFELNDFSRSSRCSELAELDVANSLLSDPATVTFGNPTITAGALTCVCPIDGSTSRILELISRLNSCSAWNAAIEKEWLDFVQFSSLDVDDRPKVLAIVAIAALQFGAAQDAKRSLRKISGIYPFGQWAENYL